MTITELVEMLDSIKEQYGDIKVYIQNGDDGGTYCGSRGITKESSTVCTVEDCQFLVLDGWDGFKPTE